MTAEELYYIDFEIRKPEVLLQRWNIAESYEGYAQHGRHCDGLMLVTGNGVQIDFLLLDGTKVHAEKNSLVYLPAGARYIMQSGKNSENETKIDDVLFNFILEDMNGKKIDFVDQPCVLTDKGGCFEKDFTQLLAAFHAPSRSMLSVKAEAYRLLEHTLSFCSGKTENSYPIRKGVAYLEQHWNMNTSMTELAALCGMSESYFRRLFQQFAGMSPVQYRNSMRMSAAKSMLLEGRMDVAEIAQAVGFEDCFYFSRAFKKSVGIPPSAYGRKHRVVSSGSGN